ncbi:MAG: HAD family hydrolase [Chloroflexi bacterium]|nr:HAD family hydrolase [Chloroflexota bacterium]
MKALIFDFDGLILDTEMPDFQSWQNVYRERGVELPLEKWGSIVGGNAASDFDPYDYLEELTGQKVDRDAIWIKRRKDYLATLETQPILPGVQGYLDDAKELGLKLGVGSSSPESWVVGHLTRLILVDYFDTICTADDVEKTKPDPELFLSVLAELDTSADQAVVFEDSPNGVLAAKRAGIYCVCVPNQLTSQLPMDTADLTLNSLEDLSLEALLEKVEKPSN